MELTDAHDFIEEALSERKSMILMCTCQVWYSGRAESFLEEGDRMIIIKQDKTVLIHQPKGSNPINYMKENTVITTNISKQHLFLNCSNMTMKEYLDVKISHVEHLVAHELEDDEKIQLAGTEKDMSEMIYKNPELIEDGFKPLSMEEHTKFGFIDIFGYDKNNVLVVIECKRDCADFKAVEQLNRYVSKVKESKGVSKIRGIIACPTITPNAYKMLREQGFEYKSINPPKYLERYDKSQKKLFDY